MKNLMWCLIMIAFAVLLVQCKTDVLNFHRRIQGNGGGNGGGPGNLNRNPNVVPNQLDADIRDLRLNNNDVQAIAAFLQSLNDESFDRQIPASVPSGLPVGGNIQ